MVNYLPEENWEGGRMKNINMFKGTSVPGHIFLISKTGYFIKGLIRLPAID